MRFPRETVGYIYIDQGSRLGGNYGNMNRTSIHDTLAKRIEPTRFLDDYATVKAFLWADQNLSKTGYDYCHDERRKCI